VIRLPLDHPAARAVRSAFPDESSSPAAPCPASPRCRTLLGSRAWSCRKQACLRRGSRVVHGRPFPAALPPPVHRRPSRYRRAGTEARPAVYISRHHPSSWDPMRKVKVLFFAADPLSAPPDGRASRLRLDEDVRQIRQKLRAAEHRHALDFDFRQAARTGDLIQALNETRPQVVHFSGHGKRDGLVLASADGARVGNAEGSHYRFLRAVGKPCARTAVRRSALPAERERRARPPRVYPATVGRFSNPTGGDGSAERSPA
jgi:hypothetical protein